MKKDTNHNNPWLDIASYSVYDAYRFKGREKAIIKFSGIVNSGIMSVLYANSGIGKTSFLNAGIDPLMIQQGYIPIHIIFPDEIFSPDYNIEKWLMEFIKAQSQTDVREWKSILNLTEDEQYKTKDILDKCSTSLWWMLHTSNLIDSEGKQYFPLLVFDQFEEVFVKSHKFGNTKLETKLFQLIEELSNSSLPLSNISDLSSPLSLREVPEILAEQDIFLNINHSADYKVIFSMRKEYLSDFDYWTQDRFSIAELQQNRMLLLPLTRKQALRVITEQPSPDDEGRKIELLNNIQDEIIQKLDPRNHNEVEPFLLSVLCSRLYEMAQKNKKKTITSEDLSAYNIETIILHFYEEKISQIIEDSRHLSRFENTLVDKDGCRNRVKIKDLSSMKFGKYQKALVDEHLIRKDTFNSDEVYVELIHDRIADAIMKKRIEGNKERARRFRVFTAAILLVITLFLLIGIPHQKTIEDCRFGTTLIDTISDASTALCDSVLELHNVHIGERAFYANPFVKTIHIKDNVTLNEYCFTDCNNLTKIIFDGDNIYVGDNAFSYCKSLYTIQITDSVHFVHVGGLTDVPQMCHFILPNNHEQCELDVLGKTLRINNVIWNQHVKSGHFPSVCCIPEKWKMHLKPEYSKVGNLKWCKNISCEQICQHNCNKDSIYYLVDTVSELPYFDSKALSFLKKNIIYVSLPNVRTIAKRTFEQAKLQKIEIPHVLTIREYAFANSDICYVDAPNVREIENYAFQRTNNLQKHIRFDFLNSIGEYVFDGDTIIKLEMPHLQYAKRNAFTRLYVDTLRLSRSLFSHMNASNGYYGVHEMDYQKSLIDIKDSLPIEDNILTITRQMEGSYTWKDPNIKMINLRDRYSKLSIGADIDTIEVIQNYSNLESISVNLLNRTYFAFKNILFCKTKDKNSYKTELIAPNQRRIFYYPGSGFLRVGNKTREIILFASYQRISIYCTEEQKKNITIYFPYGSENYIRNLTKTKALDGFKDVVEMSYLRTSYYNFAFRFVMNCHFSNYRIPLALILIFIFCACIYIKRNFNSSNFKTKLIFFVIYTIFSILGLFVIVSSPLLTEKVSTIQFLIIYIWFFIASYLALWIAYPHYSKLSILKDVLLLLLYGSLYFASLIWVGYETNPDLVKINMKSHIIVLLGIAAISLVTLIVKEKKILTHKLRRGRLILLYYIYCATLTGFTYLATMNTNIEGWTTYLMLGLVMIICGGFCISHWRVQKRMNFNYSEYIKIREQLKHQPSIPFESDSILKRRIYVCIIFVIAYIVGLGIILSGMLSVTNIIGLTVSYLLLCFLALLPIIMHIYFVRNHISTSDLIRQYTVELTAMNSLIDNHSIH